MLLLFLAKTAGALLNPNAAGALILRGHPQLLPKPVVARAAPQARGGALPGLREHVSTNSGVKEGLISPEPLQPLGMPRLPRAGGAVAGGCPGHLPAKPGEQLAASPLPDRPEFSGHRVRGSAHLQRLYPAFRDFSSTFFYSAGNTPDSRNAQLSSWGVLMASPFEKSIPVFSAR